MSDGRIASRLACTLLFCGLISLQSGGTVLAQVSADEIINALAPPRVTRGLRAPEQPPASEADQAFIESLRHRTRSLTIKESDDVAEWASAKDRPRKDIEIYFDFGSSETTAKAQPQLNELGSALRNSQLQGTVELLAGHTDGVGSEDFNQKLSERRAEAVKRYLVERFQLSADNLVTAGYGKRLLKNKSDLSAGENRRVQITNLASTNEVKR
jgi:outer membrane protein OmpA-like peptidoglycan-associated protein